MVIPAAELVAIAGDFEYAIPSSAGVTWKSDRTKTNSVTNTTNRSVPNSHPAFTTQQKNYLRLQKQAGNSYDSKLSIWKLTFTTSLRIPFFLITNILKDIYGIVIYFLWLLGQPHTLHLEEAIHQQCYVMQSTQL